ncbi:Peptidase inhibitor I78 family protein [Roseovarius sp. THAF27]|uniref:I78 family peptidase inhibitor n=1 Tax=Roseovarius sp. THAF27 TaxID=2587850 RepID=UPI0012685650|nr:I78 family peptidase inhibitor [Roseovarius sp. THAF27]QFT82648.1 Peptidase inhibitor I78 family protein [Roseovarius sp. THAF27]
MRFLAIATLTTVAACGPAVTDDGVPSRAEEEGPDICMAADHAALVGQPLDAFDQSTLDQPVRIIPPGGIVTMEYNPKRLNVDLDSDNTIVRFWCG